MFVMIQAYNGQDWSLAFSNWFQALPAPTLTIAVSASTTSVNAGSPVTFTVTRITGITTLTTFRYIISDSMSNVLLDQTSSSNVFSYTPTTAGTIICTAIAGDGITWAYAYSGWVTVSAALPLSVTLTASTTDVGQGDAVTFTVNQVSGYPITFYRYIISNNASQQLAQVDTSSPVFTYNTLSSGSIICTVMVYDGVSWATAYSSWVTVHPRVYRALLIANNYTGWSDALNAPLHDRDAMREMLKNMNGTPYNVKYGLNMSAAQIKSSIAYAFNGASAYDVSLFYFSGHGLVGSGALVGSDRVYVTPYALRQALDAIPGKKIVIIDACYSGYMIQEENVIISHSKGADPNPRASLSSFNSHFIAGFSGGGSRSSTNLVAGGYYVITACSYLQQSFESNNNSAGKYVGLFTYVLCHGSGYSELTGSRLKLNADYNGDNAITLAEIYSYVSSNYNGFATSTDGQVHYFDAQVYPKHSTQIIYSRLSN